MMPLSQAVKTFSLIFNNNGLYSTKCFYYNYQKCIGIKAVLPQCIKNSLKQIYETFIDHNIAFCNSFLVISAF
jgi:hypothetical protein